MPEYRRFLSQLKHFVINKNADGKYAIDASAVVFRDNEIQVVDGEITYGNAAALSIDGSNRIGAQAPGTVVPNPAGPGSDRAEGGASTDSTPTTDSATTDTATADPSAAPREWVYDEGVRAWGLWEWRGQGWVLVDVSESDPHAPPAPLTALTARPAPSR